MKIRYQKKIKRISDSKFNLATFHDELLKDGVMPLDVMKSKIDNWAEKMK